MDGERGEGHGLGEELGEGHRDAEGDAFRSGDSAEAEPEQSSLLRLNMCNAPIGCQPKQLKHTRGGVVGGGVRAKSQSHYRK